jgi:hypothetical protein
MALTRSWRRVPVASATPRRYSRTYGTRTQRPRARQDHRA